MKTLFLATLLLFSKTYQEDNPKKVSIDLFPQNYQETILTNLNGQTLKFSDAREKVIFVNFWQSLWGPCRDEIPSLGILAKKLENEKNIVFIFISDENPQKLREVLKNRKDEWQNFYTITSGSTLPMLERRLVPTTYIFERDNKSGNKYIGGFNWDTKEMIDALTEFAKEKPAPWGGFLY